MFTYYLERSSEHVHISPTQIWDDKTLLKVIVTAESRPGRDVYQELLREIQSITKHSNALEVGFWYLPADIESFTQETFRNKWPNGVIELSITL